YGRDAHDNQLLARLWRFAFYREARVSLGSSRAGAAEREALVTFVARQAGVPTWPVVAVGRSVDDDGLVVVERAVDDRPLTELTADQLDDPVLADAWHMLDHLHGANCAHGQIDPTTVLVGDEGFKLVDWT